MAITQGLCEICSPKQWKTISAEMLTVSGYPVYGANGIIGYYSKYNHEEPTLLITCRGATCGAINICKPYSYVNGNAMALDNLTVEVDIKYLYYYLLNRGFEDIITGSAQPQIVRQSLQKVRVTYPNKEKQIEIVTVLDKVTNLISLRKEQLAKLDLLVKSRFSEMTSNGESTVKLGDVCRMINGDRGKNYPSSNDFVERGVPFVNAGHLQDRRVNFCDMNYITEEKFNRLSQGKIQKGDILYCLRGSLGKHGLVEFERGAIASSLVILRCNQNYVIPQFLLYALEAPEIELQMRVANNGSSQPNLSAGSVKAYDIKLPPLAYQNQFAAFVEQVDKSKFEIQQSLEKLETLKKSLMQQYFG